ncbi:UvrD-helicase domain-containing protein [Blastopirellula sp. J2-11]|uniref:UvrD-helicase domain-containing protein n=1 Tax=Blastopirellula sp. J2-11 TaxID=2943192 RepID=UPI0021C685BB|nr:UvrD-helicase domain-containing protein [Blastopirellula sp. J2-11]UUO05304.1 UvrD-helicase domain-containing protein [Blastopirellula sp. J2-11]
MRPFQHRLIRASAGSGKTFQLSNRFLGVLASGDAPAEILATTFTRKAAGEILDRIMIRLAEAARDPQKLVELNSFIEAAPVTPAACVATLRELTRQLHRLRVQTLDSFFIQVAQCFSFEMGFPPGWSIADEVDDSELRINAIEELLRENEAALVLEIVHLMSKGETTRGVSQLMLDAASQFYGLFQETPAAVWTALKPRKPPQEQEIAAAKKLLLEAPLDKRMTKARNEDLARFDEGDFGGFLEKGLAKKVIDDDLSYYRAEIPADVARAYQTLISAAACEPYNLLVRQTEGAFQLLDRFDAIYRRLKFQSQAYRFDDVTRFLSRQADANSPTHVAYRLDGHINHLLLDEFQDTSPAQWSVLRPVARRVTAQPLGSFFCVGDVKQAIYGWRGGVAEIFEEVVAELGELDEAELAVSFRSSPVVIDFVNLVARNLHRHPSLDRFEDGVKRWQTMFADHSTAKTSLPGYVSVETARYDEDGDPSDEMLFVAAAERVCRSLEDSPGSEVGVLVRTNSAVRKMIFELRQRGVTASEEGGGTLTDSASVQLMMSLLQWIDHPADTVARFHVQNSPLAPIIGLTPHIGSQKGSELAQTLRSDLLVLGYGAMLRRWSQVLVEIGNSRERRRIEQLVRMAHAYQPKATLRTSDFVEFVETQRVADPQASAVRVMTIHQAKGLQFDVVVLLDLDHEFPGRSPNFVIERAAPLAPVTGIVRYANKDVQKVLPPRLQQMFTSASSQQAVEELCVLYVAITRAVHAMHVMIKPPSAREKKTPRTMAGLLTEALEVKRQPQGNDVVFAMGDAAWFAHLSAADTPRLHRMPAVARRLPIAMAPAKAQRGETLSPSKMEGGPRLKVANLLHTTDSTGRLFGSVTHAWLERIAWLNDFELNETRFREIARAIVGDALNIDHLLSRFRKTIEQPHLRQLLNRQTAPRPKFVAADAIAEVRQEQTFAIAVEGGIQNGSIDRLVLWKEGSEVVAADVVDYKTDRLAEGDAQSLADRSAFYRPQVNAYRRAVQQMWRLPEKSVSGHLYFASIDKIVEVKS